MKKYNFFKERNIDNILVESVSLIIIILGVITSIRMNMQGHSLWWDEAALAYSFSQRDLLNLTSDGLEKLQSAPVGWLYVLKIFTMLFGNTDFVLRVPSIIAYIGAVYLVWWIFKRVFHVLYPVTGAAFVATIPIFVQYSNIFKPYISDCFFSLIVIVLFYLYTKKKMNAILLGVCTSILIWFSNPVSFVVGGMLLSMLVESILKKEVRYVWDTIKVGVFVFVSFIAYYFYWLKQTATDEGMLFYWREWNLPLFPTCIEDVLQIKKCIEELFGEFYRLEYIVIIMLVACLIYALKKKDMLYTGILFSFPVCGFASAIDKFPVNKRLWLFIYPLVVILIIVCADEFINKESRKHVSKSIMGVVLLGCALLNGGIRYYWDLEHSYWPKYEVKMGYKYLVDNIKEDEGVYVCVNQTPIFDYYNHYQNGELYNLGNPVYEGDNPYLAPYDYKDDVKFIMENKKCYILSGDGWDIEGFASPLFNILYDKGYLEMVYNPYETPVWYYSTELCDSKTDVEYEIVNIENDLYLRVYNTGETYINTLYEDVTVCIYDKNYELLSRCTVIKDMEPNTYYDIKLETYIEGMCKVQLMNQYKEIEEEKEIIIER